MKRCNAFPIIILGSLIVLVPVARCTLFFDGYLIKLWIAEFGISILLIYFFWQIFFGQTNLQTNPALSGYEERLSGGKGGINTTVVSLLSAYLLINIISWLLIPPPHKYPALLTLISLFVYILLCFFVSQYLAPRASGRQDGVQGSIVSLWIITTVGISIYSIWQYLHKTRVIGTLGNENFLASHIGISIPVCIGFFWRFITPPDGHRRTGKGGGRIMLLLGLVILVLFLTTLYLTHARGAWLGLFWSLSSFAIIGWCPKGKRLIIVILLILLLTGLVCTPWGIGFITKQFQGDVRPAIWEGTIHMITERPLMGWGKGAYFIFYPQFRLQDYWLTKCPTDLTTHSHNEFLQIWAETGLIGLCVFLMLIFTVLRSGIKEIDKTMGPQRYLLLGITSGIIGLLVHNLVCNNLQMPSSAIFLWFMLGLVMAPSPLPLSPSGRGVGVRGVSRYGIFLALTLFVVIINWQIGVRPLVSQYLFKEGWQYRLEEKWDLAIEKYARAIRWYPWDVEMYYRMAYAYTMDKQYDKAIETYNDVIRFAPLYGSVHRNTGIIYVKMDEYRLAVISFLQALRINEHDLITHANLSRIRGRYGNI